MRGVNKAIVLGNCGKDPDRVHENVTKVSVATTYGRKVDGEWQNETTWHNIVFFGKLAETAAKYLKKGSQVYIEGRMQTNKWQDKEGNNRYSQEIVAKTMELLGGKPETKDAPQRDTPEFDDDIPF